MLGEQLLVLLLLLLQQAPFAILAHPTAPAQNRHHHPSLIELLGDSSPSPFVVAALQLAAASPLAVASSFVVGDASSLLAASSGGPWAASEAAS